MGKIERKYLAHFIDASFNAAGGTNYVRLGKDLEEYSEELNPEVNVSQNILGEQNVIHNGYQVQSEVSPYYAEEGDPLWEKLAEIANNRGTGTQCMSTRVDVLITESGNVTWAYREDVYIVPNSLGGDTSGIQIPFTVYNTGNRVSGSFSMNTKRFTESVTPSSP